jgi:curli biogenesis system outer membrane secretion channel CsgG
MCGLQLGLSTLTLLATPFAATAQDARVRVAVIDFENNSNWTSWGPQLGAAAADQIVGGLVRDGGFILIERARLEAILAEQSLGQSGAVDPSTATRLGGLLGVQLIVTGAVTQFSIETKSVGLGPARVTFTEAESILDVRLIDTSTGEILVVAEGSGKKRMGGAALGSGVDYQQTFDQGVAQEALRPAVDEIVAQIVGAKSALGSLASPPAAPGTVVGVRESSVYIDRGAEHGVTEGQRYDVYRVVDEIRDATGELLDTITDKVGVLEVTRVLTNSSVCKIVEGDAFEGDSIQPGMTRTSSRSGVSSLPTRPAGNGVESKEARPGGW